MFFFICYLLFVIGYWLLVILRLAQTAGCRVWPAAVVEYTLALWSRGVVSMHACIHTYLHTCLLPCGKRVAGAFTGSQWYSGPHNVSCRLDVHILTVYTPSVSLIRTCWRGTPRSWAGRKPAHAEEHATLPDACDHDKRVSRSYFFVDGQ